MARNPLTPPLSTAAVINELRLRERDTTPEARRRLAREAAAMMTPETRRAVAEKNSRLMAEAERRMAHANYLMRRSEVIAVETRSADRGDYGTFPANCPRCHAELRGRTNHARQDWLISHYNVAHPEIHQGTIGAIGD
jgi:hypothetical protein